MTEQSPLQCENAAYYRTHLADTLDKYYHFDILEEPSQYMMEIMDLGYHSSAIHKLATANGLSAETAERIALVTELAIANSLVLDDIVDGDRRRYGKPTAWSKYGVHEAILSASMMTEIIHEMLSTLSRDVHRTFIRGFKQVYRSWFLEHARSTRPISSISLKETFELYADKTAIGTAGLTAVARAANMDKETRELLRNYGRHKGIAWQISNDLVALADDRIEDNKNRHSDLENGYKTVPILVGWTIMSEADRRQFRDVYPSDTYYEAACAANLLRVNDTYRHSRMIAREWIADADRAVSSLDESTISILESFSPPEWPASWE